MSLNDSLVIEFSYPIDTVKVSIKQDLLKLKNEFAMIDKYSDLADCLTEIAGLVTKALKAKSCSILLFSTIENEAGLRMVAGYGLPTFEFKEHESLVYQIAEHTVNSSKCLYIQDINSCEFLSIEHNVNSYYKAFISLPIKSKKQVIGVINLSFSESKEMFSEVEINIANLFVLLIEKSICILHLESLINSKIFQKSTSNNVKPQCINNEAHHFIPNPEKVSKLLAKSFYKEMSKLGFQANHIIYAASEIITQLSISLEKHKKRIERNSR